MNTDSYCDRCGAQARARYFKDEQDLVFCGHHSNEFGYNLDNAGWLLDVSFMIDANPELVTAQ